MAIDWDRLTYLATDGPRTIWTYATKTVAVDMAFLRAQLPSTPPHELIPSKSGISVIFHGSAYKNLKTPVWRIRETIAAISDTIVDEGMTN